MGYEVNELERIENSTITEEVFHKTKKAALLSFLFMGLGQLYNRQYLKGLSLL